MNPDQIKSWLQKAQSEGCVEALLCLGDTPETSFPSYRNLLQSWGFSSTVDYLVWAGQEALDYGLLPHTNAGILTHEEMSRLKTVNISLGLMLENSSPRLRQRGQAHHRAPDKDPARRLKMLKEAGELNIPFTTGILIGIGETRLERIQSLQDIASIHRQYGHIQEVIVQNFRSHPLTAMATFPEPSDTQIADAIALARVILPPEISVQTPPNLNPEATALFLHYGINDLGGISPLTPDYINPNHSWPHLQELSELCDDAGRILRPRLPIYPAFLERAEYVDPSLLDLTHRQEKRLKGIQFPWDLCPLPQSPQTSCLPVLDQSCH